MSGFFGAYRNSLEEHGVGIFPLLPPLPFFDSSTKPLGSERSCCLQLASLKKSSGSHIQELVMRSNVLRTSIDFKSSQWGDLELL